MQGTGFGAVLAQGAGAGLPVFGRFRGRGHTGKGNFAINLTDPLVSNFPKCPKIWKFWGYFVSFLPQTQPETSGRFVLESGRIDVALLPCPARLAPSSGESHARVHLGSSQARPVHQAREGSRSRAGSNVPTTETETGRAAICPPRLTGWLADMQIMAEPRRVLQARLAAD